MKPLLEQGGNAAAVKIGAVDYLSKPADANDVEKALRTAGNDKPLQDRIPGAAGQPHTTIEGGGHFLCWYFP